MIPELWDRVNEPEEKMINKKLAIEVDDLWGENGHFVIVDCCGVRLAWGCWRARETANQAREFNERKTVAPTGRVSVVHCWQQVGEQHDPRTHN